MERNRKLSGAPRMFFTYPPIDEEILNLLRNRQEFVVVGHISPDGDCISSQMAMRALLLKMGKIVHLANAGPFDRSEIAHLRADFLNHIDEDLHKRNPVVVVVDCSARERLGHLAMSWKASLRSYLTITVAESNSVPTAISFLNRYPPP